MDKHTTSDALIHTLRQTVSNLPNTPSETQQLLSEALAHLERQAAIAAHISEAVITLDANHSITAWNHRAEQLYGLTASQMLGHCPTDIATYHWLTPVLDPSLLETDAWHSEQLYERDNRVMCLAMSVRPLINTAGHHDGLLVVIKDVTERKQAEMSYQMLVDNPLQGVVLVQDDKIVFVNQTFADFTGYQTTELTGISMAESTQLVHPDDRTLNYQHYRTFLAGEATISSYELRVLHRDGSIRWLEKFITRIAYQGRLALQFVYIDITERKQTNEAYQVIVNNPLQGMGIAQDGQIVFVNQAFAGIVGYSADELIGLPLQSAIDMVHPDDREMGGKYYLACMAGEPMPPRYELRLLHKNGTIRWVEQFATRTEYQSKPAFQFMCTDITERKQIETERRQLSTIMAAIADNLPVIISNVNADDTFNLIIGTALHRMNIADNQLVGYKFTDAFTMYAHYVEQVRQTGETVLFLASNPHKDDPWHYQTYLFPDPDQPGGIIGLSIDITEQKETERALRANEAKFRAVWETTADAMAISDPDGTVLDANPAYCDLYSYSPDEIVGHNFAIICPPEGRAIAQEQYLKVFNDPGPASSYEATVQRADGSIRHVESRIGFITENDGTRVAMLSSIRDITKRKQAEAERQRFFDLPKHLLLVADSNGIIQRVNPGWTEVLGYTPDELVGRPFTDFIHPGDVTTTKAEEEKVWQNMGSHSFENRYYHKDGSLRTLLWSSVPDPDSGVVYAIAQDITERKLLEAQFQQAQKMEAVGRLAGGVAHDFNNLLTAINGFSELLYLELEPTHPGRELVDKVLAAGRRAAELVRHLLAFSRKQAIAPRVLDLNRIITNLEKMLRRIIGEDIELRTELTPSLWSIKIDPNQIEQVIINLAVNARDAMPNGGHLTISTSNTSFEATAYVRPKADTLPTQDYVTVRIIDTGVGIPDEIKARIFEPFFTTKPVGQGTGLGLAMVYGVIQQHHGYINVDSTAGVGTTFEIGLPRTMEPAPPVLFSTSAIALPQGTETILLVEDDAGVRYFTQRILEDRGYTIIVTSQGQEAITVFNQYPKSIDLLITDIIMPGMHGVALAQHLMQQEPTLKCLFISGYSDSVIALAQATDIPLLHKPFTAASLALTVRQTLDT